MEAADLLASLLESHCPGLRRPCQDFHPNIAAAIDRLKVHEIILGDEKVAASPGTFDTIDGALVLRSSVKKTSS